MKTKKIHIGEIEEDGVSLYSVYEGNNVKFLKNVPMKYLLEDIAKFRKEGFTFLRLDRDFSEAEMMNLSGEKWNFFMDDEKTKELIEKGKKRFIQIFGFEPTVGIGG